MFTLDEAHALAQILAPLMELAVREMVRQLPKQQDQVEELMSDSQLDFMNPSPELRARVDVALLAIVIEKQLVPPKASLIMCAYGWILEESPAMFQELGRIQQAMKEAQNESR